MIHRICTGPPYSWYEWPDGKLIWLTPHDRDPFPGEQRGILEAGADKLGPKDVIGIRLFHGCLLPGPEPPLKEKRLSDYDDTIALIRELSPVGVGWLLGQQGHELSYRHHFGNWNGDAGKNLRHISEFMKKGADLLYGLGATHIYFATMDWDLLQDAYRGGRVVLRALNETKATNYCACGYTMVPGTYTKPHVLHKGQQLRWQYKRLDLDPAKKAELPTIEDYLHEGKFWTGLCGKPGIEAGNIQRLSEYGFSGFASHLTDQDVRDLDATMEGWRRGFVVDSDNNDRDG